MYKTQDPRAHFTLRSAFEVSLLQWRLVEVERSDHSAVTAWQRRYGLEIDVQWTFIHRAIGLHTSLSRHLFQNPSLLLTNGLLDAVTLKANGASQAVTVDGLQRYIWQWHLTCIEILKWSNTATSQC